MQLLIRRSEHDEFMAGEARAMDHARRVAERRGYPQPPVPFGRQPQPTKPAQPARPEGVAL